MSYSRQAIAVLWALLGIGLFASDTYDAIQWSATAIAFDSLVLNAGLSIVVDASCLWLALGVWRNSSTAKPLGILLSIVLSLHVLYVFAITPSEFKVRPALALKIGILLLSAFTTAWLFRKPVQ